MSVLSNFLQLVRRNAFLVPSRLASPVYSAAALLIMLIAGIAKGQGVVTWSPPEGFASNRYYSVKVNGIDIPVYDTPIASYACFDFTGPVVVDVSTMFDVRWAEIRPLRLNLTPEYTSDHSFRFPLAQPAKFSIELNGRIRQQPLFIFAGSPERDKPRKGDKNVIWFESGKLYKNVRLELKDNEKVYIEGGAVVQGLIYAINRKNIEIRGRGILDGSLNFQQNENKKRFIDIRDCEGFSIKDIILHNGTTWQIAVFHSSRIKIENVKIVSEYGGDDGMDIFRSRNVLVDGVFAHTKDDCIAIKSGGDYPANHATDSIVVKNCVFWNSIWGNAVEVGFELYSNEVKNILFENIDIIHVEDGAALSIHNAGPAHVHNVIFDNIRIEDARQKLFDVAIFFSQWGPDGNRDKDFVEKHYLHGAWDGVQKIPAGKEDYHKKFRGTISDITFRNIHVVAGPLPFSVFHGFDLTHQVSNIIIENLTYQQKRLTTLHEAKVRTQNTHNISIR